MPKIRYPKPPEPSAGKTYRFPDGSTFNLAPAGQGYVLIELGDTQGEILMVEIEDVRVPEIFVWAIACTGYSPDALMAKHRGKGKAFGASLYPKTRIPAEPETFTDRFGDQLTISHMRPDKVRFSIRSTDGRKVSISFADVLLAPLFMAGAQATGLSPAQITQKALDTGVLKPEAQRPNRAQRRLAAQSKILSR